MTKGGAVHPAVARGLAKLGTDIGFARRARAISTTEMARRMGVGRSTLHRLESGDPGVSVNTVAMALVALGLLERLADLVDPASDDLGLTLSRKSLPKKVVRRPTRRAESETEPKSKPATGGFDEPEGW